MTLKLLKLLLPGLVVVFVSQALADEPTPILQAVRIQRDFVPDGNLAKSVWSNAPPVRLERRTTDGQGLAELSTRVRALWSREFLYLAFECPFTRLTVFEPPLPEGRERIGSKPGEHLWNRDVVEAFVSAGGTNLHRYGEFQVAPTNERLDLWVKSGKGDDLWNSGFTSGVRVDDVRRVWTAELRIPLSRLSPAPPETSTRWRANFFRKDFAHEALLAWHPSLKPTFHVPDRFGGLEFAGPER